MIFLLMVPIILTAAASDDRPGRGSLNVAASKRSVKSETIRFCPPLRGGAGR